MKPDDYVLTSKGKLGQLILPGFKDLQNKHFQPASVAIGNRVYQIWPENLTIVTHVTIRVMEGEVILTASSAVKLIKVLLRNKLSFEIINSTYSKHPMSELQHQLFSWD